MPIITRSLSTVKLDVNAIKAANKIEVARTKSLVEKVLSIDKVKAQIGANGVKQILSEVGSYVNPWVDDLSRGGEVAAKEVNAVTDNVSITD